MKFRKLKTRLSGLIAAAMMASPAYAQIALHVDENCKGPALSTSVADADVNYPVDSVKIFSGVWEVCRGSGFRNCETVRKQGCSDLDDIRFWGQVRSVRPLADAEKASAILYRDTGFRGPAVYIENPKSGLSDLGFAPSSIRIKSGKWQICSAPGYVGSCEVISEDTENLHAFGIARLGSLRPHAGESATPATGASLYAHRKCKGLSREKAGPDSDINFPTRSIKVEGGWWQVCSKENFGGICKNLKEGCTDFEDFGFFGQVRSARPADVANPKPEPK